MLLKGCQGKIIRVRSADSRVFDEAFFVLREDAAPPRESDMLAEANRILEESMLRPRRTERGRAPLLFFALGAVAASLLWLLLLLLF